MQNRNGGQGIVWHFVFFDTNTKLAACFPLFSHVGVSKKSKALSSCASVLRLVVVQLVNRCECLDLTSNKRIVCDPKNKSTIYMFVICHNEVDFNNFPTV